MVCQWAHLALCFPPVPDPFLCPNMFSFCLQFITSHFFWNRARLSTKITLWKVVTCLPPKPVRLLGPDCHSPCQLGALASSPQIFLVISAKIGTPALSPTYPLTPSALLISTGLVLVSCGCYKKLPQPSWLKTAEVYSLSSGSEVQNHFSKLKSGCHQGGAPFWGAREDHFLPLQLLVAACTPWLVAVLLQFLLLWSHCFLFCLCVCVKSPTAFHLKHTWIIQDNLLSQDDYLITSVI